MTRARRATLRPLPFTLRPTLRPPTPICTNKIRAPYDLTAKNPQRGSEPPAPAFSLRCRAFRHPTSRPDPRTSHPENVSFDQCLPASSHPVATSPPLPLAIFLVLSSIPDWHTSRTNPK